MAEYDALVIGGGHNGLVLANYLAKAGLKTLILESRLEIGGGLCTEEITIPGFHHNLHSYFHDTINIMPAYRDLGIEELNARYIRPPVQAGLPLKDGTALTFHTDIEDTVRAISKLSERDAKTYREMQENYLEFMEAVVVPALYTAPQPPSVQLEALEATPEGLDYLRMGRMSPRGVVDELFENEQVKALILHQLPIPRGILHDYHGLGFVIPLIVSQVEHSQICLGGSHVLAHALWRALVGNGGAVKAPFRVAKILIENGQAVGVESAYGERIYAKKLVASSIDLRRTFVNLIGEEHLSSEFIKRVKSFKLDEFSVFAVHLALKEPPIHKVKSGYEQVNQALRLDIGLETPEDFDILWGEIRRHELPSHLGMICSAPTLFDKGQAPEGYHTAFLWQPAPYRLKGTDWNEVKEEYAESLLAKWREYAPNLTKENILMKAIMTPLDMEAKLNNMVEGGVFMGRLSLDQLEYFRPLPELSQYRTPISNLYLAGACTHPGGGILGATGFIAANVIADDLALNKWWE